MEQDLLQGVSVTVVGAGLAGLSAAVDLHRQGAAVRVIEARSRVGGRVWTIRDGFEGNQHAEAGGDLIEDDQEEIVRLTHEFNLQLVPILHQGFAFVRQGSRNRMLQSGPSSHLWRTLAKRLAPWVRAYQLAEARWDSPIALAFGNMSVAEWIEHIHADAELRAMVRGLRGFFLADPSDLSLLVLIDQLSTESLGPGKMYRVKGGNDLLTERLAQVLKDRLHLHTAALAVRQTREHVRLRVRSRRGECTDLVCDYLVMAVPATTLRELTFQPGLPVEQDRAIRRLKYGPATKALLQFDRRFWVKKSCPRAYGTDLPIGAIWDANEDQQGRKGILTLLAGGSASREIRKLLDQDGVRGLLPFLEWIGEPGALLGSRIISWEEDEWVRGGYSYFDPSYDPLLRQWLARSCGRVVFAGEHTSMRWQGYMNGAVESGRRAAAEVRALIAQCRRYEG